MKFNLRSLSGICALLFFSHSALISAQAQTSELNIEIGKINGSGAQTLNNTNSFAFNFGVTSSAGTLNLSNIRLALSRGNSTTAPVIIEIFSGLGGTGTLLRRVEIAASSVNQGSMTYSPVSLGDPLSLQQGGYSVRVSTQASGTGATYSFRPDVLTIGDTQGVTLGSGWIQDNNTTGTAGNTLTPATGYVLADHAFSTSTVNLGRFHTGGTGATTTLSYNNAAPATTGNVTESLTVSHSATGNAIVTTIPSTHTVQGGSNNITLGVTNAAGAQNGTVQLNFNSVQTGSSSSRVGDPQSVGSRTITVTGTGYTGRSEWTANQNGSWNKDEFSRWDANGGTPGLDGSASVGDTALFGSAATAARTITLDGNSPQLRELTFNNANNGYTIATGTGNASLALGNATHAGSMSNQAGQHSISANVVLGNRLTYNGAASSMTTISGAISGNGHGLTKQGAGTLRLTGNNTFTGTTTVEAGTLIINGTSDSATTVQAGATLGGSGTINGNTTIAGIHSPGNSPGLQTFTSGLTYAPGSSVLWELIANDTSGRGTNYDAIDVTGTLNFAGTTTLNMVFNFTGEPTSSTVDWANSFWDHSITGTNGWEIFRVAEGGSIVGFENLELGGLLIDSQGNVLSSSRGSFSLFKSDNSIYLNYTANTNVIPETSVSLLGLMGMTVLLRRRRSS